MKTQLPYPLSSFDVKEDIDHLLGTSVWENLVAYFGLPANTEHVDIIAVKAYDIDGNEIN